jgi:formylglycine-generating enzyme required for sulfatase activity
MTPIRTLVLLALLAAPAAGAAAQSPGEGPTPGAVDSLAIPGTSVVFRMAWVPGGTYVMGSPEGEEGRDADEGPAREVTVEPFWMGVHEVTWDEYAVFRFADRDADSTAASAGGYLADAAARPSPPYEDPSHGMGNEGRPAAGMTQWAALQYAKWLSGKTGEFYRLPTEAEWEFACRGGTDRPLAGVALDRAAWMFENSGETFHAVGGKRANAWGLHDMLGNVAEWTLDEYVPDYFDRLPDEGATSPWVAPTRLHPRTVRGGAYDDDPEAVRCAARLESNLNWKRRDPQIPKSFWWNTDSPFVGFRLVRPAVPPPADEIEFFWTRVLGG